MSAFILDLTTLRNGLSQVAVETGAQDLDLPVAEWPGAIRGTFDVEKSGDRVSVRGFLEARPRLECVRCLKSFDHPMRVVFQVFADRAGSGSRRDEEALDRDAYMLFHDGRRLDLREEARESLLTETPMAPHCRDDCAGLCPRCGADLNAGPHACPRDIHEEKIHGGTQT
jgi:uncharacterized protein